MLLTNTRLDPRAVRVPLAVMSEDGSRIVCALDCRVTPSRYISQRLRRMRRLARAPVIEVSGAEQASAAPEAVRAVLESAG